nr:uncharacterized protein CTRU02_07367 [Colletotrichum truncatum]KAF6791605.1 hypothetical protein CTRU02_07367 [Colletotrichum truncatum]
MLKVFMHYGSLYLAEEPRLSKSFHKDVLAPSCGAWRSLVKSVWVPSGPGKRILEDGRNQSQSQNEPICVRRRLKRSPKTQDQRLMRRLISTFPRRPFPLRDYGTFTVP